MASTTLTGYRRRAAGIAAALTLLLVGGGCRRPPVQTVPPMPALEVPPAPPRNVEPTEAQAPAPVPLVDAPTRTVERPRVVVPSAQRERTEPKPEPPIEPVRVDDERPAATLQTTTTDRESDVERRIRGLLQAASTDLNRIDYRKLNPDPQLQYDTAKSFIRQSEEALKSKNLVLAQTMAEKAATLASQLAPR
jgi:hypothetical protein